MDKFRTVGCVHKLTRTWWLYTLAYLALLPLAYLTSESGPFFQPKILVLIPVSVLLLLRQKYPYLLILGIFATHALSMAMVAAIQIFALAVHSKGRAIKLMTVLTFLSASAFAAWLISLDIPEEWTFAYIAGGMITLVLVAWVMPWFGGSFVRLSREREAALRLRASSAEAERELRARDAVQKERERIAAEMHDSLGHRLAVLTMQAGALELRAGDGPEFVSAQAEAIRATARDALQELRGAIGSLRPDEYTPSARTLEDLPALLEESRAAGATITVTSNVDLPGAKADTTASADPSTTDDEDATGGCDVEIPEPLSRTVFRVIQEGLTNAYRHSPGAPVFIDLNSDGETLTVTIRNALPPGWLQAAQRRAEEDAGGFGLVALGERVRMSGGTLEATPHRGEFHLTANLPCPERQEGDEQ